MNLEKIRADFPCLHQEVHGKRIIYLDSGATTLKPEMVSNAVKEHYDTYTSNVHRGVHYLSEKATTAYEGTREKIKNLIGAKKIEEIIFTSGTTASLNMVASTFGEKFIEQGDQILVSEMEHHSNIVPWQLIATKYGAKVIKIPVTETGEIDMEAYQGLLNERVKIIAVNYISNTLGTINPVKEIISAAHSVGAKVVLDGAQAVSHLKVDVQELDCDFFAFSGHKLFGPTGTGVLYGKEKLLEELPPYMGGGDMIDIVSFEGTSFNSLPYKFEAGTPNIAGFIGLSAAIDYFNAQDLESLWKHEADLATYGQQKLSQIDKVKIIGNAPGKTCIFSFVIENLHAHDVGTFCNEDALAVRTGHHCTQPLMQKFGVSSTARASLSFYNTKAEIDILANVLEKIVKLFT